MKKFLKRFALVVAGSVASVPAFAAGGPDFSALTGSVDFTSASTAILAIFGLLGTVYVVMKGGSLIMGVLKGK